MVGLVLLHVSAARYSRSPNFIRSGLTALPGEKVDPESGLAGKTWIHGSELTEFTMWTRGIIQSGLTEKWTRDWWNRNTGDTYFFVRDDALSTVYGD